MENYFLCNIYYKYNSTTLKDKKALLVSILARKLYYLLIFLLMASCANDKAKFNSVKDDSYSQKSEPSIVHPGQIVYMQFCIACHMEDGEGVDGLNPPLTRTDYVLGDKKKLIEIILNGMEGPIVVNGKHYNNLMQKLDYLTDEQIAGVLSYVRSSFGNNSDSVKVDEVRLVRNHSKQL